MFTAFNLSLSNASTYSDPTSHDELQEMSDFLNTNIYSDAHKQLRELSNYLSNDGTLDGDKIIGEWFPFNSFDIFLSHSHLDTSFALYFAYHMKKSCGLNVFIDSIFWGYADKLLKEIDNEYAYQESSETYSYNTRNKTTSNVYLMLNAALSEMIYKTECLIFVNSENSTYQGGDSSDLYNKSHYSTSPWIMSELNFSSKVQTIYPERYKKGVRTVSTEDAMLESLSKSLKIKYKLPISHLKNLSANDFYDWFIHVLKTDLNSTEALDYLYEKSKLGFHKKD